MNREVLIDASTVVTATETLVGAAPSTLGLLNLASLIETLVLYDSYTVLDTGSNSNSQLSESVSFINEAGFDIAILARNPRQVANDLDDARRSEDPSSGVVMGLDFFASLDQADDEMRSYLDWLQEAYSMISEDRADDGMAPHLASEIVPTIAGLARFVAEIGRVQTPSLFTAWLTNRPVSYFDFAANSILRTQTYLAMGEILSIPYRPDVLRWPITWKLLAGNRRTGLLADHLLRLVEDTENRQIEVAESLGCILSIPLPLLLRPVFAEADEPRNLLPEIKALRHSPEAVRLREAIDVLTIAEAEGDYRKVTKDFQILGTALANAVGSNAGLDIIFSVVGATGGMATALVDPSLASALAAGKSGQGVSEHVRSRWRQRRFAALTTTLSDHSVVATSLADVERVLGWVPPEHEIRLLTTPAARWSQQRKRLSGN